MGPTIANQRSFLNDSSAPLWFLPAWLLLHLPLSLTMRLEAHSDYCNLPWVKASVGRALSIIRLSVKQFVIWLESIKHLGRSRPFELERLTGRHSDRLTKWQLFDIKEALDIILRVVQIDVYRIWLRVSQMKAYAGFVLDN